LRALRKKQIKRIGCEAPLRVVGGVTMQSRIKHGEMENENVSDRHCDRIHDKLRLRSGDAKRVSRHMVHDHQQRRGRDVRLSINGLSARGHVFEITATEMRGSNLPVSCVVRTVTQFDVCPWGMIFRNRQRAQALRSFQINPYGPGYQIVFQCSNPDQSKIVGGSWAMEKDAIRMGFSREYRCPWDRGK
jgi:hypothetical protein